MQRTSKKLMQRTFPKAKNICNNQKIQESAKNRQNLQINDGTDTRTQMRALRFSMSVVATHLICIFLLRLHGSLVRHCGAFFSHLLQNQRSLNHPVAFGCRARPICFLVQPWHWGYWHCKQAIETSYSEHTKSAYIGSARSTMTALVWRGMGSRSGKLKVCLSVVIFCSTISIYRFSYSHGHS